MKLRFEDRAQGESPCKAFLFNSSVWSYAYTHLYIIL